MGITYWQTYVTSLTNLRYDNICNVRESHKFNILGNSIDRLTLDHSVKKFHLHMCFLFFFFKPTAKKISFFYGCVYISLNWIVYALIETCSILGFIDFHRYYTPLLKSDFIYSFYFCSWIDAIFFNFFHILQHEFIDTFSILSLWNEILLSIHHWAQLNLPNNPSICRLKHGFLSDSQ